MKPNILAMLEPTSFILPPGPAARTRSRSEGVVCTSPTPLGMRYGFARMKLTVGALSALCFTFGSAACGVVYPEVQTPLRTPPPGFALVPPPPDDLLYLRFEGADVPAKTVDGRSWDDGGGLPDPYAKL